MKTLFEQFKSGERTDIYERSKDTFGRKFLVYLKYDGIGKDNKMLFNSQVISLGSSGNFEFSESYISARESTVNNFQEISAEQFYEAYDLYVKYQSCVTTLKEIFNK